MDFFIQGQRPIAVQYDSWMDGGGTWFGQEYMDIVPRYFPEQRFRRTLEWCSGPGFIGYGLLSHGITETVCLMDTYLPAIERAQETVTQHDLQELVSTYHVSSIAQLPSTEQFDLVVGNPPHFLETPTKDANNQRIEVDQEWKIHREFWQSIGHYLLPGGVVLLQENRSGSRCNDWIPMIHDSGLEFQGCFPSRDYFEVNGPCQIYYVHARKKI